MQAEQQLLEVTRASTEALQRAQKRSEEVLLAQQQNFHDAATRQQEILLTSLLGRVTKRPQTCQGTPRFPQLGDTQIPALWLPGVFVGWGRGRVGFLLSARGSSRGPQSRGQASRASLSAAQGPLARRGQ